MKYEVKTTETFDKIFKKKHRDKVEWLKKIKEKLSNRPESGKPLRGRLHGIWQIRMGPFRIWYEIDHVNRVVILKAILHKDEAIRRY